MDGLRLVFVNHCHPEMAHVCALRARSFAETMARRAHQVVVLSETLRPDDDASADELGRALMAHDWTIPFRLACPPRRAPLLRRAREIAKRSAAPWAMDLKDGWDQFVPAGMRGSTARRFAGAAAAAALSEAHVAELGRVLEQVVD